MHDLHATPIKLDPGSELAPPDLPKHISLFPITSVSGFLKQSLYDDGDLKNVERERDEAWNNRSPSALVYDEGLCGI